MIKKLFEELKQFIPLRSLRARVFFIIVVVGLLPIVLMRYGFMMSYEERAVEQRISIVQNQLKIVGNHLISNDYFLENSENLSVSASKAVIDAELETISNLYEGRVMIINSGMRVVKDTYGLSEGKTIVSEEVIKCFRGSNTARYDKEHGYIEMTVPIVDANLFAENTKVSDQGIVGVMLTSISDEAISGMLEVLNRKALIWQNLIIVIVVGIALGLSKVLIRPFDRVTEAINEVKAGYSDESISVPDYVETVHIVDAFNQLLGRMRALDNSRQDFVANVSHELKTPMASMKVLADSLLAQGEAPVELYREFMEDIVSEVDRENRIITDLLALVKLENRVQELNYAVLNINDLVELILKRLRPIARKHNVDLVFESMRNVTAEVDEVKMTLIMSNLVENAIKYNKEHGWVKVELDADHQFFTFKVTDSGVGIPEESMHYIYDRFYRVDKSHSREIGGTGLGLAITKNAVLLHRGSITVNSTLGEGSCFVVKIPLNRV